MSANTNTASQIAFGIAIAYATTSGGTYTTLAELLNMKPGESQGDTVKVMRSDNPAGPVEEQIPSWISVTDYEVDITYQAGGGAAAKALMMQPLYWKVTYPKVAGQTTTGDTEIFYGFIRSVGRETALKDAMKVTLKMAVNGDIAFTAGS